MHMHAHAYAFAARTNDACANCANTSVLSFFSPPPSLGPHSSPTVLLARKLSVSSVFCGAAKIIPLAGLSLRHQPRLPAVKHLSGKSAMPHDAMAALPPRPPPNYAVLRVSPSQILLHLTISNKCGQAFRWRGVEVYERVEDDVKQETNGFTTVKKEENDVHSLSAAFSAAPARYRTTTEWSMCIADRVVFVRQDEERNCIYYTTRTPQLDVTTEDFDRLQAESGVWLRDYLNLSVPLAELYEEWSIKDPVFKRFAARFSGVRMLRQDPLETLCAFICSSNNNIARIGQMVQNLCTHFSEPFLSITYPAPPADLYGTPGSDGADDDVQLAPTTIVYYPFPAVERLAGAEVDARLRSLSFGYRSRYIQDTARLLLDIVEERDGVASVSAYLHSLRTMSYADARQELLQFSGVGPKVADCILLMAMDQPSSIPVDRHVFQFAERWYKIRTKGGQKGYEHIADTFRQLWGPYAGWAHSVLFTADLRAFQTYKLEESTIAKKEEYVDTEHGNGIETALSVAAIPVLKEESEEAFPVVSAPLLGDIAVTTVAEESPRAARFNKRVAANPSLHKTFKGTKRSRSSALPVKSEAP